MKLTKSLLLASAAGLVAGSGAMAADLGVKKPSAVEYVKTCPAYKAGFFVVPGTTSCLKIVGRVRADYIFLDGRTRTADKTRFRARGYIGYDHRTATEYGLLRTYAFIRIGRDNAGAYSTVLEHAFIQFGGLTAGRTTPVFETGYYWTMGARASGNGGFGGSADLLYHNQFIYTAKLGSGFSATISAGSANERRSASTTPIIGGAYGGQAMPDIVGRLDYGGAWGRVMVAGALHQIRNNNAVVDTKYGWAITGGGKINLPFISKGSNLFVMGTVAEGANTYTGFNTIGAGNVTIRTADAIVSGGSLRLSKTFGVVGGLQVYLTPTIWAGVTGAYASYNPFGGSNKVNTAWVAGNLFWVPVPGFVIGSELEYRSVVNSTVGAAHAQVAAGVDKSTLTGRLRFQRSF